MKLNRRTFALLVAGVLSLGAADAFGGVPLLPPGARPPAGWAWCPRCEGRRHVPSGFLGWTSKPCPQCNATGMVRLPPPPPPVVVPPPAVKPQHHHRKPAPAVQRKPAHHRAAPKPQQQHRAAPKPQQHHQPGPGGQQRPGQQPRR